MCLCGMLAAEHSTLPAPMRRALQVFFDANERWLAGVLETGRRKGELKLAGAAREEARLLVAGLEGALLVARSYDDPRRFQDAAARLIGGVLGSAGRTGLSGPLRRTELRAHGWSASNHRGLPLRPEHVAEERVVAMAAHQADRAAVPSGLRPVRNR